MTEQEWLVSTDPQAMWLYLTANNAAKQPHLLGRYPVVSDRKLRLFVCACCRQVWHLLTDERSRRAVEVAERYADRETTDEELKNAHDAAFRVWSNSIEANPAGLARYAVLNNVSYAVEAITRPGLRNVPAPGTQAALLRDIFGNPYHPVTLPMVSVWSNVFGAGAFCPWLTWNDCIVARLAQAAYDERVGWKCETCNQPGRIRGRQPWLINALCPDCSGSGVISDGTLDAWRLAVLADSLEDAGCTDTSILNHLRGDCSRCGHSRQAHSGHTHALGSSEPTHCSRGCGCLAYVALPHVRGCWVLDLLLGKE